MDVWCWIERFLEDPKWAGVQGMIAIIALAAVAIAAIDLTIRIRTTRMNAVSFTINKSPSPILGLKPETIVECTVIARPMGPSTWYEPEWQIFGTTRRTPDDELLPIMTARESATVTLSIPYAELESVWVGIAWVEPRISGSRSRGARLSLEGSRYQRWETYRWWWWPRKDAGRWVEPKNRASRLLQSPTD